MKATTGETTNNNESVRNQWLTLSDNERVRFSSMMIAATEWLVDLVEETEKRVNNAPRINRTSRAA